MTVYVKAEDVANAIVTRLATITVAQGAETDIGLNIQRGRRRIPAEDEVPLIQFVEGGDEVEDVAGKTQSALAKITAVYVIDAFALCDPDNPNVVAHKMIRDIKRVIFAGGRTLGGKVAEVEYLGRDIGPRSDGVAMVQARVTIRVSYAEDLANP